MVTIIKIDRVEGNDWVFEINEIFEETHKMVIFDCVLVKESPCGKFEELFLFMDNYEVNTFINLLLERNVGVYSKVDFTKDLIAIVNGNTIDEFKGTFNGMNEFDNIISSFVLNHIDKDMVLDKLSALGITALTESDYTILDA